MRKCSTKVRPNPRDAPWTRNVELVDVSARFIAFEGGDGCGVGKLDENNEVGQSKDKINVPMPNKRIFLTYSGIRISQLK